MITARFRLDGRKTVGVEISGHSGYDEYSRDIVCAAVTSAVGLCESAITDIIGANAAITVEPEKALISIELTEQAGSTRFKAAEQMLAALMLHLTSIRDDYAEFIQVLEV